MATDKKWMQKAAASIKRRGTEGKCTPIAQDAIQFSMNKLRFRE